MGNNLLQTEGGHIVFLEAQLAEQKKRAEKAETQLEKSYNECDKCWIKGYQVYDKLQKVREWYKQNKKWIDFKRANTYILEEIIGLQTSDKDVSKGDEK